MCMGNDGGVKLFIIVIISLVHFATQNCMSIIMMCQHHNLILHVCTHIISANTTVTGSPELITPDDAKETVAQAAPLGDPKPIDPIGI